MCGHLYVKVAQAKENVRGVVTRGYEKRTVAEVKCKCGIKIT